METELEISGQGNYFALAGTVKQLPYLLFLKGQSE
jgi:hypothetical protein